MIQINIENNTMKLFKHSISNFQIKYPENWEVKEEENIISLYDPKNGYGALQFTVYFVDNNDIDIKVELEEYIKSRHENYEIFKEKPFLAHGYNVIEEEKHWQYWIYKRNNFLVFASYNCAKEDIGKERGEIKSILENTFIS